MNPAARILELQGKYQPLIKKLARQLQLPLDDARQQAALACCLAVQSFDPSRGDMDAWVASTICCKMKQLAFGHDDGDSLRYADGIDGDLADKLAAQPEDDKDAREIPALSGIYGRIRALALQGLEEEEIANVMGYSKRRIQQLLKDADGIRAAARLGGAQGDLFGGVQA